MLASGHEPPESAEARREPRARSRAEAAAPASAAITLTGGGPPDDDPLARLLARAVAARAPQRAGVRERSLSRPPPAPAARTLSRREVRAAADIRGAHDWTAADRRTGSARWKAACLANLAALDSGQYRRIVERRDFYRWFYEHTIARGYTTRWPLAASIVANGAHQVADMDEEHAIANDMLGLAGVELQGVMREVNQVIFDNVLPKLKQLLDGGPLTGAAALRWDMQVLAEEQTLVQPMYARMSRDALAEIDYIARQRRLAGWGARRTDAGRVLSAPGVEPGYVPPFDRPSLSSIGDRWSYGMALGDRFTPGGSGFQPSTGMPPVHPDYARGTEFARVDVRPNLHYVDAWLNPERLSRGPVANLVAALRRLTPREREELLADSSPDGWAYSIQLATWSPTVDEAVVRAALPSTPSTRAAVDAFVARFRAEAARIEGAYATPWPHGMP